MTTSNIVVAILVYGCVSYTTGHGHGILVYGCVSYTAGHGHGILVGYVSYTAGHGHGTYNTLYILVHGSKHPAKDKVVSKC